ncbi:hypothetical protein [Saccharothrix obliqua]|uniref:hypothetical protein n=1 Tax=Saccharothrix obliqua TaxID=2861747 RepID=UPI001C607C5F|nr:hypothetical protein [Saccharothrix obliqua]MBW4721650.1 hypothetical protein [Saccharothrix obliqua]
MDAKLAEELRLLLDAAAERAQPWLNRLSENDHDPGTCGWCPLCNAVALARGDRSELAARAAEHVTGLIAVLREALTDPPRAAGTSPAPEPAAARPATAEPAATEEPPPPRVEHIPVVRRRS